MTTLIITVIGIIGVVVGLALWVVSSALGQSHRLGRKEILSDTQADILGKIGEAEEVEREIESDRAVTPSDRLSREWSRD